MGATLSRSVFVSIALAFSLWATTAMGQGGFVRVEVYRDTLTMISVPLNVTDSALNGNTGCVGDMIAGVLTGGAGAAYADVIWRWDAASQSYQTAFLIDGWGPPYDGRWWDEATDRFSTMILDVGDAFWIQRRNGGEAVETIAFLGWAPIEETKTITFVKGLTMFNYPYPIALALNQSTLDAAAYPGSGAATADLVWEWLPLEGRYLTAFYDPWRRVWVDPETGQPSAMEFAPGKAFWYQRRPDNAAKWTVHKPYS